MPQDDPWAVPYADLDAVREAQEKGKRKIWPWVLVASVIVVALAVGVGVAVLFLKDDLDDLKAHGRIGQRVWLAANAYAAPGPTDKQETAEVGYALDHHLPNDPKAKREVFKQTVTLPWSMAVDLEGSLVGIAFTVTVPQKGDGNLKGPTCAVRLDNSYLANTQPPGYESTVTCQWSFQTEQSER